MSAEVKLGPEKADKIAILGSAPSTTMLAPFDDQSWAIWACSPGCFAQVATKRVDAWFELHRWMPYKPGQSGAPGTRPWLSPEYSQFLQEFKGPVFFTEQQAMPNAVPFPYQELLEKFGPYHFTSTIAWMLAFAITRQPKAIGLFGIDMAAGEEWAYQRPGCQHFVGMAKSMGIDVYLPPESDLMRHSTLYGIGEHNQRHVKLTAKLREIEANKVAAEQQIQIASTTVHQCNAAIAMLKYVLELWSDDLDPRIEQAMSFAGSHVRPPSPAAESTGAEVLTIKELKLG